jgi:LuxR family maltose regulon positive regulatory protein
LISVLTLFALLYQAKGDDKKAMRELEKAVTLAEPGGFIRLFVDLGEPMRLALVKLQKQGVSPDYIARILSAFEKQELQMESGERTKAAALGTLQISYGVTNREQEVLQLLEKRYTDKEIAEALSISKETVHSHIAHLSDKLGTNGRRAIVQTAREIGLLD